MNHSKLPQFIAPMLARPGKPFDSTEHLFEVKWDGMRLLTYVDASGYRLVSRHGQDITDRFPELGFLSDLPSGTVLDGELVVLRDGKPDFSLKEGTPTGLHNPGESNSAGTPGIQEWTPRIVVRISGVSGPP